MITLNILALLAENGFGTVDTDMFWEEMSVDSKGNPKQGIWIVSRGAPLSRFNVTTQRFDIYARYANKVTCSQKLEDILQFMQDAYDTVCELPAVQQSLTNYINVRIRPTSGIENVGLDENGKIVKVISGEVQYERN